jgi:hypothetical protein
MNCLTVCIGYDDLLAITLPRNRDHFRRVLIVTSPEDRKTEAVAIANDSEVYKTDAFRRAGAALNKGLMIEEGLDHLGREGWIAVMDADIVLPRKMALGEIRPQSLYGAHRKMLVEPRDFRDVMDWSVLPDMRAERAEVEVPGYFHLFHASDPVLTERPWFPVDWRHCGGYDSEFQSRWAKANRKWLPFEVLHLGANGQNWCGRVTPRIDTGEIPSEATQRRHLIQGFMDGRSRSGTYALEKLPKT